jgi:hypothetical protein
MEHDVKNFYLKNSLSLSHTHTHTHTNTLSRALTHKHRLSLSLIHTHIRTHTHALFVCVFTVNESYSEFMSCTDLTIKRNYFSIQH